MSETTPGLNVNEVHLETQQAADLLGVPARTLLRMADRGRISFERTEGGDNGLGHRRFKLADVQALKRKGAPEIDRANSRLTPEQLAASVNTTEAQEILGVTYQTLWRWEQEGRITAIRPTVKNRIRYDRKTIEAIAEARAAGTVDE